MESSIVDVVIGENLKNLQNKHKRCYILEIAKEFELYRKFEVVLFRYFKIAEFVENSIKFSFKTKDDISTILDPKGYDNAKNRTLKEINDQNIYIPFNPFYLDKDDKEFFTIIFPKKFWEIKDTEREKREALKEIWSRIHEIKWWLGVTKDTRFCGIRKESRLTTVLENYLKSGIKEFRYDFEHSVFRNIDKETIRKFLRVMKNRKRREGIISMSQKRQRTTYRSRKNGKRVS